MNNFSLSVAIPQLVSGDIGCYIRVENIEPFYQELKGRKTKFCYELLKMPWQMNEMQIDDPYGNAIRFGESL